MADSRILQTVGDDVSLIIRRIQRLEPPYVGSYGFLNQPCYNDYNDT